jgi:acyl-CoA synthetase (AMP-forming)/AMP-acid ligase II
MVPEDLRLVASAYPKRVAVEVVGGESMTYAEWDQRADQAAGSFASLGVQPGDRVALLLGPESATTFHTAYVATHRAGAIAVPINPRYAAREVAHVLADAGPRVVVAAAAQADRARELAPGATVLDETAWSDAISSGLDAPAIELSGDDLAEIFYTSGTTGLPKGVASTHAHAAHMKATPMPDGGVLLHSMPLSTFTGVAGAVLTPMRLAATATVLPRFDAGRFASLIERKRARWLLMVPAHILMLLESGALQQIDTSTVQAVMFGGAPTPPSAVQLLAALLPGAVLLNGYGLTEGGGSVCVLPPGEARRRPGSVGKPMSGVSVRIVDPETATEVGVGEVGEITLKLPAGKRSYYNDPEATAQTWRDGWVHTGDLGRIDEDGFLYVVDRTKDMIIRGGYNIYSVEVEAALHEHPDIVEAGVVGVEHRVLGQDIAAVVRLRDGADPLTLESLAPMLDERLAHYKHPRRLLIVDEPLPRNASGKLDKQALRGLV